MPDNIVKAIQSNKRPVFDPPEKPDKKKCVDKEGDFDADKFEMAKFTWKEDWKLVNQRKIKYEENEANAWALVYNQCSHELRVKLEGTSGYEASKRDNNLISLLAMIRGYCCQFDALNDEYVAIGMAIKNLLYYFQKPSQTNSGYHQDILAMVETIEDYGGVGSLTYFPNMIKKELIAVKQVNGNSGTTTSEEQKEARKIVREKFLDALMLNGLNQSKYGELKRSMAKNFVTGTNEYPTSPEMVLRILNAYVPPPG
jgi:hypothetical protein